MLCGLWLSRKRDALRVSEMEPSWPLDRRTILLDHSIVSYFFQSVGFNTPSVRIIYVTGTSVVYTNHNTTIHHNQN